ncbi:CPBP family intramembrane glutamic endopeptidase [Calothrix rhizosoleniae]|uniref:CPBP family intramembrane glutamic endopeptidase n=1 Tax=Calothrix rhizosoleniae TaxID=888997 RepID=UPI000B497AD2|nr:type II CAAX endopeptidase family protein [Calothrix rhizosoleniae]
MNINVSTLAVSPIFLRLGCLILALLVLWLPLAVPIYLLVSDSNLASILAMALLYVEFIFLIRWWGKKVYNQPQIFRYYGLEFGRQSWVELIRGLAIGLISILVLFGLQGLMGWVFWIPVDDTLIDVALEGLLVSLAVGLAEELVFRGWLLDELQRDYAPHVALWVSGIIFAILHFIKPLEVILNSWTQFLGLIVLGVTLVWAKRWGNGRLSIPIGIHAGLVWGYYMINVGELIEYSGKVPEWVTGIQGNPLAGLMGLVFLSAIARWVRGQTVKNTPVNIP